MLELFLTSFPALIQYYLLRRRGEAMTVANMKTAVFLWLCLAAALFTTIFYYHPKSYTGIVPFRTVSVVAQAGGPVIDLPVSSGQRVEKGDLLFRIENSSQKASLQKAMTASANLDASEAKAKNSLQIAMANVEQANAALANMEQKLADAEKLVKANVGRKNQAETLRLSVQGAQAGLAAALAQVDLSKTEITDVIPAARNAAKADYDAAKVDLDKTEVRSFTSGTVTQMALSVGSPASRLIVSPSMIIVPDRDKNIPIRIVAGFPQVAKSVLYVGMPAEIACDSNANIKMTNSVMGARVVGIQPAVAAGQITPGGNLIELNSRAQRGTLVVYFELAYKGHEAMLLDGSGCIIQTYTSNLSGTVGHVIGATGLIKAFLLRTKVWGVLIAGVGLVGGGH